MAIPFRGTCAAFIYAVYVAVPPDFGFAREPHARHLAEDHGIKSSARAGEGGHTPLEKTHHEAECRKRQCTIESFRWLPAALS